MSHNKPDRRPINSDAAVKPESGSRSSGAHNTDSGGLEVIDDDELRAILDDNQNLKPAGRPSDVTLDQPEADAGSDLDELSLVSTQALQKMLVGDEKKPQPKPVENAGFNPYDKNDGATDPEENA